MKVECKYIIWQEKTDQLLLMATGNKSWRGVLSFEGATPTRFDGTSEQDVLDRMKSYVRKTIDDVLGGVIEGTLRQGSFVHDHEVEEAPRLGCTVTIRGIDVDEAYWGTDLSRSHVHDNKALVAELRRLADVLDDDEVGSADVIIIRR